MNTHAIGDVHGCLDELVLLMERLRPDLQKERIVFTGDLVDRGPDSFGVVRHVKDLQKKHGMDHVIVLRGNHEQMMLDADTSSWRAFSSGYRQSALSHNSVNMQRKEVIEYLESLPLFFEEQNTIYVHAGLKPGIPLHSQCADDLLWIREEFYEHPHHWDKTIVFGHTPTTMLAGKATPWVQGHLIGIDTGCVFGGALTAITVDTHGRLLQTTQVPGFIRNRTEHPLSVQSA